MNVHYNMPESSYSLDDIYVYIFSWKYVTGNALRLYESVSPHFPNTFFINCDENASSLPIESDRLIQLDDRYYYGGQFHTAINNIPKGKILACIVGDVSPEADWANIAAKSIHYLNRGDIGIYAPNVNRTSWVKRYNKIIDELYDVENTDCTCWFIHPLIVDNLSVLNYFSISNLGWGIDIIYCKDAISQKLHVARDYSVIVMQPCGTGYSSETATRQMHAIISAYNALIDNTNKSV